MQSAEIDRGEPSALQQRNRQRVAERRLHQRRGRGCQIVRACLSRLRDREHHVGRSAERTVADRGHGNEPDAEAARVVDQMLELDRLS